MLLEDDRNTKIPQLAGIVERVHGIPCKAGDGFGEDQVDFTLTALADHTQEVLALTGGGAGDALVGEYLHHGPFWIFHDLFRVVGKLVFVTGQLLLAVGGHAAVRRLVSTMSLSLHPLVVFQPYFDLFTDICNLPDALPQ